MTSNLDPASLEAARVAYYEHLRDHDDSPMDPFEEVSQSEAFIDIFAATEAAITAYLDILSHSTPHAPQAEPFGWVITSKLGNENFTRDAETVKNCLAHALTVTAVYRAPQAEGVSEAMVRFIKRYSHEHPNGVHRVAATEILDGLATLTRPGDKGEGTAE